MTSDSPTGHTGYTGHAEHAGRGAGAPPAAEDETRDANRRWWDAEAADYYAEHGTFLGDDDLVWGPEGVTEDDLGLLGDLEGRTVLEFGAGAAQGARYAARAGARVVASDLSAAMLEQARRIDGRTPDGPGLPLVQADACALPFADASFDLVFSAYGAVPFVAHSAGLLRECARVLRPGGRLVFSTTHPIRWAFPDVPGEAGLTASMSYFDRTPYTERTGRRLEYAEHHRTLGDRVREITAAGLHLVDLVEPEWPETTTDTWGGWSPLRGRLIPGTAIFVCVRAPACEP
ncbi:class I SAM-dependent methyltransferase [Mobilicoccus caccae]|uniref:SAM-dependent methyltransferase n=1 Tax=Mobilicoccus caccae TaxID=1859295 RepID=A0ABQ6IRY5_9MICO|nr:class I SAM-dependent methyltransferase [Mobilicoccus caccae]GMA39453.1 SAM-dependent methyltransferase [Mobilicoccus caccae]